MKDSELDRDERVKEMVKTVEEFLGVTFNDDASDIQIRFVLNAITVWSRNIAETLTGNNRHSICLANRFLPEESRVVEFEPDAPTTTGDPDV